MPRTLNILQTTFHRNKKTIKAILEKKDMLTLPDPKIENYELQDSDESEQNENDGCDLNEEVVACQLLA